ncbi:MAG: holo-ACP synthase [Actinobacteria bacterium]|nr:holo-ACP synthase [Actinomycetota bacterium]
MLGVDVVDIERLRKTFERFPQLEDRLFNDEERAYCRSFPDPIERFAGTLAAKEAVIKALRLGPLVAWAQRIEISRAEGGEPTARVRGGGADREVNVSISHDGPVAVAVALSP